MTACAAEPLEPGTTMRTSLLLSLLALAAPLPAQESDFGIPVATTLSAVRADPDAFRGVKVTFTIQFTSLGRISNPFFTRFTPSDYVNFYAWADEQPIWQKSAYSDPFAMLFYSKLGKKLEQVYSLRLYERVRVEGVVRNTFQDMPWIEVLDFAPVGGQLDTATLAHLYRGEQLMAQRRWQRAIAELSMAAGDNLPAPAAAAMQKNLGTCYLRLGEAAQAVAHLRRATELQVVPDLETERLLAVASVRPEQELDRTADARILKDNERPMWTAFEGEQPRLGRTVR